LFQSLFATILSFLKCSHQDSGNSANGISAVMALTASMRILRGELWLPRFWPASRNSAEKRSSYEEPYSVDQLEKFYVFFIGIAALAALGCELSTLWGVLPVWGIIGAVASGAVIGMLSSRVLTLEKVQDWSHKTHLLFVALFAAPIAVGLFVILQYVQR